MANSLEFIAGEGIAIAVNDANKSFTLKNTSALTAEQMNLLKDGLTGSNKFVTLEEIKRLIGTDNPATAPEGFPKLILSSGKFVIPKTGKYKIRLVGGGGAGSVNGDGEGNFGGGAAGTATKILFGDQVLIANGGAGGGINVGGKATIAYDGTKGACSGGDKGQAGGNGVGNGGEKPSSQYSSGSGGGPPFPYNSHIVYGKEPRSVASDDKSYNGYGYGAGGGGIMG